MRLKSLVQPAIAGLFLAVATSGAAGASVLITVDKSSQQMLVSLDGTPRYQWPVSTGSSGYDTPAGSFKPSRMAVEHFSKEWDDAPMPHSIFFTDRGHAIHGSNQTRRLGTPASHGCVRLAPQNAATLFSLVEAEGMANTRIVVTGFGTGGGGVAMTPRGPARGEPGVRLGPEWDTYYADLTPPPADDPPPAGAFPKPAPRKAWHSAPATPYRQNAPGAYAPGYGSPPGYPRGGANGWR